MDQHPNHPRYDPDQYKETNSGNVLGKKTLIFMKKDQITYGGRSIVQNSCIIRGDLASINFGKYCIVEEACILKPSYKKTSGYILEKLFA